MSILAADEVAGQAVSRYDDAAQQWRGAIDRIRETAKWIVVIFGAIGGVLAGTAPLSRASSLSWDAQGQTALAMAVVTLAGLGLTIGAASAVLLPRTVTLRDLAENRRFRGLRKKAKRDPSLYLLPYAESIEGFFAIWHRDMRSIRQFEPLRQEHERDAVATARIEAALWVVIERVKCHGADCPASSVHGRVRGGPPPVLPAPTGDLRRGSLRRDRHRGISGRRWDDRYPLNSAGPHPGIITRRRSRPCSVESLPLLPCAVQESIEENTRNYPPNTPSSRNQ